MISDTSSQLLRDEGEVLHVYLDSLGFQTIGVGHLVDPRKNGAIPIEISRSLLAWDINDKTSQVLARLPWVAQLDAARRGVIINMAFQLGISGLLGFDHTLSLVQTGQYGPASKAMLASIWASQTPERAMRLSKQMETGVWQ